MTTPTRIPLSGATAGLQIPLTTTATAGNVIHTASNTQRDYVTLRATNISAGSVVVTVERGGTVQGQQVKVTVPGKVGQVTLLDRALMQSSLVCAAFADTASTINIDGWVDRI